MDDNQKIMVLMIYYRHWGQEEAYCRKVIHGANSMRKKVQAIINFPEEPSDLVDQYRLGPWFWQSLTDSFLQELGGIPMEIDMVWTKNPLRRVAENIHQPLSLFWKIGPNNDELRAIDAIIALM